MTSVVRVFMGVVGTATLLCVLVMFIDQPGVTWNWHPHMIVAEVAGLVAGLALVIGCLATVPSAQPVPARVLNDLALEVLYWYDRVNMRAVAPRGESQCKVWANLQVSVEALRAEVDGSGHADR